ncbi:hypothetical protein GF377_02890 [candidate division GN15 bacterium]|nr:hypothetical protein [candidate division GN15 bacterium]
MRCRKVRSLLSTYSRNELTGRQQAEVREHLAVCADCRKEAAVYASINAASREIPEKSVSSDFNTKLLNRIAEERFAETRTKAYMPKQPPMVSWGKVVPAVAMAALVVVVAISIILPGGQQSPGTLASGDNDLYRTVQPTDNPNFDTVLLSKNWSLNRILARLERVDNVTESISRGNGFTQAQLASSMPRALIWQQRPTPYSATYHKMQPVIKVYEVPRSVQSQEGEKVY